MATTTQARGKVITVSGRKDAIHSVEVAEWTDQHTQARRGTTATLYEITPRPYADADDTFTALGQITVGRAVQHCMVGSFARLYYLYTSADGTRGVGQLYGDRLCVLHDEIVPEILRWFRD